MCRGVAPQVLSHEEFDAAKTRLGGMQQREASFACNVGAESLPRAVVTGVACAALTLQPSREGTFRFSAVRLADQAVVLVELSLRDGGARCEAQVNCDDFMFSGHVCEAVKAAVAARID